MKFFYYISYKFISFNLINFLKHIYLTFKKKFSPFIIITFLHSKNLYENVEL